MSNTSGECRRKKELIDEVFSWSLEEILNEEIFKDKVETIPKSFQSVEQYFKSFAYPLLEETRAELASSLEAVSRAPYAKVLTFNPIKRNQAISFGTRVESWRNRSNVQGKQPYRTLPGDIFVLTDIKPETVSDLRLYGRTWAPAALSKLSDYGHNDDDDDGLSATSFEVKLSSAIDVSSLGKSLFVVFLMNITTNKRIWNSLQMARNVKVIKHILSADTLVEKKCGRPAEDSSIPVEEYEGVLSKLNKSQKRVIETSLSKLQCKHRSSVELVWGPPGTGKTKSLSTLLFILAKIKCRTVICAPTNIAIAEVASRLVKLVEESLEASAASECSLHSLGDILFSSNKEWVKQHSGIEEIHLDYRIGMLEECFGLSGWRSGFTSTIQLLEDCVSEYHIFVENENNRDSISSNERSFLGFLRRRFRYSALPLRKCITTLCTHFPRTLISNSNFEAAVSLANLLESFEKMLSLNKLSSNKLLTLFSGNEVDSLLHSRDTLTLLQIKRIECLKLLKTLRDRLDRLDLPRFVNRDEIVKFCFRNASLILCTASGCYKLHSVIQEPLNLLIIDEAAQLKECESTIALQLPGITHAVLFGDECQLPAMVTSKVSAKVGFGRSLFERLSSMDHPKHLLEIQYRMHPSISLFPNSRFYAKRILDAANVTSSSYVKNYLPGPMFGPYSLINIPCGREETDGHTSSHKNMVEAAVVVKIVQKLRGAWDSLKGKLSVGIVSPYTAQIVEIQKSVGLKYDHPDGFTVKVKSIDGFQGGEEDVIILSTVRSNYRGSVGFMSNLQRINVALTRARYCLWILGDERTLCKSNSIWKSVVKDAKDRRCFFDVEEDEELAKFLLEVKKELDQFGDLLHSGSILFKNARWKLLFSDNFRKSFQNLKSSEVKSLAINLLQRLSTGWRPKRKVDVTCKHLSQMLKQFRVKQHLFLVWSVDIERETWYSQILRIWDILALEDIPKLVKNVDALFGAYTDDYLNRCKYKCLEGDLEVPMIWHDNVVRYKSSTIAESGTSSSSGCVEDGKVRDDLLLTKFYTKSSDLARHLLSGCDGREVDLPFQVTEEQKKILHFPKSSFILGSSGTGKTTILTMKLLQRQQLYQLATEGFCQGKQSEDNAEDKTDTLRQLFVAVSSRLCHGVKQHISRLRSACGWGISEESSEIDLDDIDEASQFAEIPDSFVNLPQASYPLVITFTKFLVMLDGTVGRSFFERFPEARRLFRERRSSKFVCLQSLIRGKEVTYEKFCSSYWPHFNGHLTKKLDPSTVFTQILSHIKGGSKAVETRDGKMSRQDYISLSKARTSSLSEDERSRVYEIFLHYEKKKRGNGEYDLSDLVIDVHSRLEKEGYRGVNMDFVYIDEVQDLTMRQVALFKYICKNFEEGFVFSGDTAQTIARGVDFRFEDIRSLFYKEFVLESSGPGNDVNKEKGLMSEIFNLSRNFRTNAGVLNLAQSIVDLLHYFFPSSIYFLSPETSQMDGELPVLVDAGIEKLKCLFKSTIHGDIGFGAEQVILVRNEDTKREVVEHIGKQALVLTIMECKGLEFEDVLLYGFFGKSPIKSAWEVIYGYMKDQKLPTRPRHFSCFNKVKHSTMCYELKQLYVAISRTKRRLWIWDEGLPHSLLYYWETLRLVTVRRPDDCFFQEIKVPSSREEWKSRGMQLFHQQNYQMAKKCFEKAQESYLEKWAEAAGLRSAANCLRQSDPNMSQAYLRTAAYLYESIGKADYAAQCLLQLKEY